MITEVAVGTACVTCRKIGHYCRSVLALNGMPMCDTCLNEEPCAAEIAHKVRITGLGGEEQGTFSGPVKQIRLSRSERKPFREAEPKSAWRQEFERRSAEAAKAPKARLSETAKEARKAATPRIRKQSVHRLLQAQRFCACGKKMKSQNKKGMCHTCSQKNRNRRVDMRQCKHEGCLEKINSRNVVGLCRWHNPSSAYRAKFKNSQPKMIQEAA
jgi:hypothetical protein